MAGRRWLRFSSTRHKIAPTDCQQKPAASEGLILPQDQERSFSDLPQQLLEAILSKFTTDQCAPRNAKDIFSAIGVCRSWRAAGHAVFFNDSWSGYQAQCGFTIQHPAQLITLCPLQQSAGGHIQCYVQRQLVGSSLGSKTYRFVLSQGTDDTHSSGKFLLAALQDGKQGYAIYLNRSCSGKPIAQLRANIMRTAYVLTVPSNESSSSSRRRRNYSKDAATGIQQMQQQQQHGVWCGCASHGSTAAPAAGAAAAAAGTAQELARVTYKLRVRGIMLPRRMSVAIPAPQQQQFISKPSTAATYAILASASTSTSAAAAAAAAAAMKVACSEIQDDVMQQQDQDTLLAVAEQVPPSPPAAAAAAESTIAAAGYAPTCSSSSSVVCGCGFCVFMHAPSSSSSSSSAAVGRCGTSSSESVPLLGTPWQQQQQWQATTPPHQQQQQQLLASPSFTAVLQLQLQQQQSQQEQHLPLHFLHNKAPHWNEGLRCWCLNFRGRVRLASVKNFQLITNPKAKSGINTVSDVSLHGSGVSFGSSSSGSSGLTLASTSSSGISSSSFDSSAAAAAAVAAAARPDSQAGNATTPEINTVIKGSARTGGIVTQFGKVETNVYVLDYDPVLINGLQAFAVALTSFWHKGAAVKWIGVRGSDLQDGSWYVLRTCEAPVI